MKMSQNLTIRIVQVPQCSMLVPYLSESISPQNVKVIGCICYQTSKLQSVYCYKTFILQDICCYWVTRTIDVTGLQHNTALCGVDCLAGIEWITGHQNKRYLVEVTSCNLSVTRRCRSCNTYVTYSTYTFCGIICFVTLAFVKSCVSLN
jgi:hypothetical protein